MRPFKSTLLACFGVSLLLLPGTLAADKEWKTPLTLGEPTEIPGTTLQPGKYVVRVVDIQEPRKVVQFLNADETKVFATVMAVPSYRVQSGEGQFIYFQRGEGLPQALKAWFYPGNNFGVEFVYPRPEAEKLAQARKEEVYSAESARPEAQEKVVAISPELKEREVEVRQPPAREPAPAPREAPAAVAQSEPPVAPANPPETTSADAPRTLPSTGSALPLLALGGLAAIGAGALLRLVRRF